MSRIYLTVEEALDILPAGEEIHTFLCAPIALIGADWSREDVEDKIRRSGYREVTGATARGMNHGLALYSDGDKYVDIVFVETDMDKLDARYPHEEDEEE